jgi:UDP-glucose 4-epimerase
MAKQPTILITGGAGYVGSHAALALKQAGYSILILDNLVYGHRDFVEEVLESELIFGSVNDRALLDQIFSEREISGVLHFAAYTYVRESVEKPEIYYWNNVVATLTLAEAMVKAGINKLVFSSTCATYGAPSQIPMTEDHPQFPLSPYGWTKLVGEKILVDFERAHGLKSVCFRYFNAAGAHPSGRLGEDRTPETHLIPLMLMTALGKRDAITIYGTDYDTPDGTCIRDYIHVTDLAQAHLLGLDYLLQGGDSNTFNLGNGNGFSVREVIWAGMEVTGRSFTVLEAERRLGDPPILVGSARKAQTVLNWQPTRTNLHVILEDSWRWHNHRHGGAVG